MSGRSSILMRGCAAAVLLLLVFSIWLPSTCAARTFNLNPGEIDSEALTGGQLTEVSITVTTPNASIDVYVLPTIDFSENPHLLEDFDPIPRYTFINLTTNITYRFTFNETEPGNYEIILDNSDNFKENDTVPWLNETIEVVVDLRFPKDATAVLYKGIIAAFIVAVFCGGVVAKSIREAVLRKKPKRPF